jgi:ankyrin repeat protein
MEKRLAKICINGSANEMAEFLKKNPAMNLNNSIYDEEEEEDNIPLNIAIGEDNYEVAEFLICVAGVDVNHGEDTPLGTAANLGNEKITKLLLEQPYVDPNKFNSCGWTPLYTAARYNYDYIMEHLLSHTNKDPSLCLDVNKPNKDGDTAIHLAAEYGYTNCAKLLLDHPDFNVNQPNGHGKTALHIAIFDADEVDDSDHVGLVELILSSKQHVHTTLNIPAAIASFKISSLIGEYEKSPASCRLRLRAKFGYHLQDAADLFGLVTLINEGLLQCNEETNQQQTKAKRFFKITLGLPVELRMRLCNQTYRVKEDFVSSQRLQKSLVMLITSLL